MKIAICDDDSIFNDELTKILYDYAKSHNIEPYIDTYESGYDLLSGETKYDLIIMDYQMPGLNGIETAAKLREGLNIFSCIIFLTNFPEIAISAYEVDTYRFVVKSRLNTDLFKALDDYRKTTDFDHDVRIKTDNGFLTISTKDIIYFESHNKYISIFLSDRNNITTLCRLSEFLKKVPSAYFGQTHKSYAVNYRYITKHLPNELNLNDYTIPISRNYQKRFKEKYKIFLKDYR